MAEQTMQTLKENPIPVSVQSQPQQQEQPAQQLQKNKGTKITKH